MAETTKFYRTSKPRDKEKTGYERWPVENVQRDLENKGGLKRRSLIAKNNGFDSYLAVHKGVYNGQVFGMRWVKGSFLVLTAEEECPELVAGFSRVLESQPFIKYAYPENKDEPIAQRFTVEWDLNNPEDRPDSVAKRYETLTKRWAGLIEEGRLQLVKLEGFPISSSGRI